MGSANRGLIIRTGRCPDEPAGFPRLRRIDRLCHHASLLSRKLQSAGVGSAATSIISRSNFPELSKNIIKRRLAFARDWSGTVAHSGSEDARRSCPAGSVADVGLRWCGATPLSTAEDLKCQRLRINHHLLRLFPSLLQTPRCPLLTIQRAGAPIAAPSNPASSRCCNHPKEQRLRQ